MHRNIREQWFQRVLWLVYGTLCFSITPVKGKHLLLWLSIHWTAEWVFIYLPEEEDKPECFQIWFNAYFHMCLSQKKADDVRSKPSFVGRATTPLRHLRLSLGARRIGVIVEWKMMVPILLFHALPLINYSMVSAGSFLMTIVII